MSRFINKKFAVILLITSTCLVYNLPYLSNTFYTQFLETYGLTNEELGTLMTFFSLTATPGYLFGGLLADKFNPKKLLIISLLMTATLGYTMFFISGYYVLLACYFGFGISTTFIHWNAALKLIRIQANDDDQGNTFGVFEWCYALCSAFTSYGLLAALKYINSFKLASAIYATVLVFIAVLIVIFLKNENSVNFANDNGFKLSMAGKALSHPVTWINGLIVMGMFIVVTGISYLNPYLSGVYGTSVEFGTSFSIMNKCIIRLLVVTIGGMLIDRWKTPKFMAIFMIFLGSSIVAMIILPQDSGLMTVAVIIAFLIVIFLSTARSGMYTPIPEAKIPLTITGTAMASALR